MKVALCSCCRPTAVSCDLSVDWRREEPRAERASGGIMIRLVALVDLF